MRLSYVCHHCGREVKRSRYGYMATQLLMENICSECDYWLGVAQKDQTNLWAINGELFELIPGVKEPFEKTHMILTPDGAFETTHLFNYGRIPGHFTDKFPKKARFIKPRVFKRVTTRPNYKCRHKGCWGRKDCWWYRGDDDYNEIPKNIGENPEGCKLFIPKIK